MGDRAAKTALFDEFARAAKALASGRRIEMLDVLANGERTGTCWVYIDYANQLDACIVLIAEGMRAGDRATSDDPDAECLSVRRSSHLAKPSIAALCCARIASRITSKVCFWGQAFSVRLITSCTKSG